MSVNPNVKVIFCDGVSIKKTDSGYENVIVNAYEELRPYNIPGNFTFTVVLMISEMDCSVVNGYSVIFTDFNGNDIFRVKDLSLPNEIKAGVKSRIQLTIDCRNVVFKEEGTYKIKVFQDDVEIYNDSIEVKKGSD